MEKRADLLTHVARAASVVLGIAAALTATAAVVSFFRLGPESGATGVVLVDSVFGTFILFVASRFLWIYARKRVRNRAAAAETGASSAAGK